MTTHHGFDESQRAQQSGRTSSSSGTSGPPKIEYPSEEPPEDHVPHTKSHSMACTVLERSIEDACDDIAVGGDQFIYYVEGDPSQCLAPDVFVKRDNDIRNFDSWFTWEEGTPELAVEIVSVSDRMKLTWEEKLERYNNSGILEVVRFDPKYENGVRIWDRKGDKLVERPVEHSGTHECRALSMYWTVRIHPDYGRQLRLSRDRQGQDLLPTPSETSLELARQLVAERAARSLAEHEQRVAQRVLRDAKHKQRDAEQKQRDAEQKQRDAERNLLDAQQKLLDEAQARQAAEQKQREAEAKLAALLAEMERRNGT